LAVLRFAVETLVALFDASRYARNGDFTWRSYDVSRDDRRFLMIQEEGWAVSRL
jgi:hypothetical protein